MLPTNQTLVSCKFIKGNIAYTEWVNLNTKILYCYAQKQEMKTFALILNHVLQKAV